MNGQTRSMGRRMATLILTVIILVTAGLGFTSASAKSAIPGDALYPLKTTLEQTRLTLARDAGDRAELKLRFADQRLEEMGALIKEGRYSEVSSVVLSFESQLNSAILELESVSKDDPARAGQIASQVTAALSRYAAMLGSLAASAPESVRPEVLRALDSTQIAGGLDLSSSGMDDNSNDSINANTNTSLDDNSNSAMEDNSNSALDDNSNGSLDDNGNVNGDDSVINGNTNGGADDHGGNTNTGADDNTNTGGGGTNSNTNDDSGGSGGGGGGGGGGGSGSGGGSDDNSNGSHD